MATSAADQPDPETAARLADAGEGIGGRVVRIERVGSDMAIDAKVAPELVNRPLVKAWLWWGLIWLTLFPIVGVLVSIKFHHPGFLDGTSWLTFGRLRPVHVNGVIFGSFSAGFLALLYYLVPTLCGVRMYKEHWGWWLLWLWNALLVLSNAFVASGRLSVLV